MVTRNNKLEIFESFQIEGSLPKFNKGRNVDLTQSLTGNAGSNIPTGNGTIFITQGTSAATTIGGTWGTVAVNPSNFGWDVGTEIVSDKKKSFWDRFKIGNKEVKEQRQKTMTILNFFSSLAQSLNDLKTLQDIGIHYEIAISNATKAGQTALVDKLKTRLESAKSEVQLVTIGLVKYLTEDQVVDFYHKSKKDKNLKLTWIKHFVKPIPSIALDAKSNLDNQFVFDNYVILHYDPNNDATDLTNVEKEEEIKRKKDPILFGVIKDSRRLYYIADWQDEYCNLTLDTVIETLQEKVGEINNESVKTYIDLGVRNDVREKLPEPKHESFSATTVQFPIGFYEKVEEKIKQFFPKKKKKDGMGLITGKPFRKMGRTSSAKEIDKNIKANKKKK